MFLAASNSRWPKLSVEIGTPGLVLYHPQLMTYKSREKPKIQSPTIEQNGLLKDVNYKAGEF